MQFTPRNLIKATVASVACAAAGGALVQAAQMSKPNIKPGLWEITTNPKVSGEMPIPEEQLAKTRYLAGGEITAVDLAVYPIYAGRKALPDNAGLKHLQAWGERIGSRPGVQKGMKLEN